MLFTTDELERFKESFLRKLVLAKPSIASAVLLARPTVISETHTVNDASCMAMLASCLREGVGGMELVISEECREWMMGKWIGLSVEDDDFGCTVLAVCAVLWQTFTDSVVSECQSTCSVYLE